MGLFGWVGKLIPRDSEYFSLLEASAANLSAAGKEIQRLIAASSLSEINAISVRVKEIEHSSDEFTHRIFDQLNRSFITPIDREDIHALASFLDDTLDQIDAVAARVALLQVDHLSEEMKELVRLFGEATEEADLLIRELRSFRKNSGFFARVRKIHQIEESGDVAFRKGMAKLFKSDSSASELLKQKDILEGLERSLDLCKALAKAVEQVCIKNS